MEAIVLLDRIRTKLKQEVVLCVAAVCALLTVILVPPDGEYPGYIDLRVLCLLFSLMAVVAGFQACGVFHFLTAQILRRCGNGRILSVMLVLLPCFSAMLVTNDVALLVFVPFTLGLLEEIDCRRAAIPLLVLQTIGANLGSMATPVGNPQNLFLYAAYALTAGEFFAAVLPLTAVSLLCLTAVALPILPRRLPELRLRQESLHQPRHLAVYGLLFILCLLTVFRILPHWLTTVAVLLVLLVLNRGLLRGLDYALLATFVCFFLVSGNLGRVPSVRAFLQTLLERNALLTAVGTSQVISNVPAAVLFSGFTDQWKALLQGVNIGGLGTPIASLASLITLKQYLRWPGARAGKFLLFFTLANLAGLVILLFATMLL